MKQTQKDELNGKQCSENLADETDSLIFLFSDVKT